MERYTQSHCTHSRAALPAVAVLVLWAAGCVDRPLEKPLLTTQMVCPELVPQFVDKDVDILFVVDNSDSMADEQKKLAQEFPRLIDALRTAKLGNKIPNVRIGVVSTDLGAGNYQLPGCQFEGDRGKLLSKPQVAGCTAPKDPWISYHEGVTNVPNGAGKDPVQQVKEAFSCVARLGTGGCGFEQPLEAARLALDPNVNRNPQFLRNDPKSSRDALLVVVFITDEDDCSAQNPQLFDPSNAALGPLHSFRCFEYGVTCEGDKDPRKPGVRKQCKAGGTHLRNIQNYVKFFQNLKKTPDGKPNPQRVLMAAIAGPTGLVKVIDDGGTPALEKQCKVAGQDDSGAVPGIRIRELVHAFAPALSQKEILDIKAKRSDTPYFVDDKGVWREENYTSICSASYGSALARIGKAIVGALSTLCMSPPALTDNGGILCRKGDVLYRDAAGKAVVCQESCLHKANFAVNEVSPSGRRALNRCPKALFDPSVPRAQCGEHCGCWRLVPDAACKAEADRGTGISPYAVEVMRTGPAAKGTYLEVVPMCADEPWGVAAFADLPQCT